jgi:hypothetical protein
MPKKDDEEFPQFDLFGDNSGQPTEAYARRGDPSTSKRAARKISYTNTEREVYNVLKETGVRMTSLCIMRYLQKAKGGEIVWSVSPRLAPLWRKGAILKAGVMTVVGSNGKPSTLQAWIINPESLPKPPEDLPPLPPPLVKEEQLPGPTNAYYDEENRLIHDTCGIEGCTKKPGHSIGCSTLHGRLGMWYCEEHFNQLKRVDVS